jgi:hypothetical protein
MVKCLELSSVVSDHIGFQLDRIASIAQIFVFSENEKYGNQSPELIPIRPQSVCYTI